MSNMLFLKFTPDHKKSCPAPFFKVSGTAAAVFPTIPYHSFAEPQSTAPAFPEKKGSPPAKASKTHFAPAHPVPATRRKQTQIPDAPSCDTSFQSNLCLEPDNITFKMSINYRIKSCSAALGGYPFAALHECRLIKLYQQLFCHTVFFWELRLIRPCSDTGK